MRIFFTMATLLLTAGSVGPNKLPTPTFHYKLAPDAVAQDGVPVGEVKGPFTLPSEAYPGTQHTYWIYVPAQYDPQVPSSLMIFNDRQAFNESGRRHARAGGDGQPDLPA
jgi:hypothetical protein